MKNEFEVGDKVEWTQTTGKITGKGATYNLSTRQGKVHEPGEEVTIVMYRKKKIAIHNDRLQKVGDGPSQLTKAFLEMGDKF